MSPVLVKLSKSALSGADMILDRGIARLSDASRVARFLRGRLDFVPRSDDIYVASYPRSGTTWMQFIVHLLVSGGSTSFRHINEVTPWFERSLASRRDAAASFEERSSPRVFKTHLVYRWLPRSGRIIYLERDGMDVALSYHRLHTDYLEYRGTFEEFLPLFLKGRVQYGSWFEHVEGWERQRGNPRVTFVSYEEMRSDLSVCVRRVADFCRLPLSGALLDEIRASASLDAMRGRQEAFEHAGEILLQRGIRPGRFIGEGRVGGGVARASDEQRRMFEAYRKRARFDRDNEWRLADFLH
jgi:hypothetical protein